MGTDRLPEIEVISEHADHPAVERAGGLAALMVVVGLVIAMTGVAVVVLTGGDGSGADDLADDLAAEPTSEQAPSADPLDSSDARRAALLAEQLPAPLLAAELFAAFPSRTTAAALLEAVGGVSALELGLAEGAFDHVTFDPADPDHLLASHRSTYGPADNRDRNEEWFVGAGLVSQELFAPEQPHDVAEFNPDGTITLWESAGDDGNFAARIATVQGGVDRPTSSSLFASRSVVTSGTIVALTGSEDYYSPERTFEALIADRQGVRIELDGGEPWARIDSPTPGIVVAYPRTDDGATRAWDATTLESADTHALAGRPYAAVAVSGDGRLGVGITLDGELESIDMTDGTVVDRFGFADPRAAAGIVRPLTLNEDGTILITVGRIGTVGIWWVGDDEPIVSIAGSAGPARVAPEHRAPRSSSAIEPTGRRVALKMRASPGRPVTWRILDTDMASWVERACDAAGRTLTTDERELLGLNRSAPACGA